MAIYFSALNNRITGTGKVPVSFSVFILSFMKAKPRRKSDGVIGAKPLKSLKAPVYGIYTVRTEKLVAFRKMLTAEKSAESG